MPTVWMLLGLVVAYLLGSVPSGYWLAKAFKGLDIRQHGSGNIGASNVRRVLGNRWGIVVLLMDIAKGTLAVVMGQEMFWAIKGPLSLDFYKFLCAAAAVCGHNWTIFLGFKGGKGVATSAGALLGVAPVLLLGSVIVWGVVAKTSGYICVASMSSAVAFGILTFVFKTSLEMKIFGIVMAGMLIVRHRGNIQRLISGTEPKIGQTAKANVSDVLR